MAGCDITKGKIQLQCKNAVGGLKAIYIANYADYGFTKSSTEDGHILTDLGTLDEVFKFALKNSGNTYQEDIQANRDNGTTVFSQALNVVLTRLNKEMAYQVKMLAWGNPIIFVESAMGDIIAIGVENGCEVSGNGAIQGTMDSLNGYTLTATGTEREPAYFLDSATITALKALVSTAEIGITTPPTSPELLP